MKKRKVKLFDRLYNRGRMSEDRDQGINIESETFKDLRFEIIKDEVIVKSSGCGVLMIALKNCEDFGVELIEISKIYGR